MKNNRLLNFLDEIRLQCLFIVRAKDELDAAAAMHSRQPAAEELSSPPRLVAVLRAARTRSDAVWYAAQQLIVAHGIVSTLLWDASDEAERRSLRRLLNVGDDSLFRFERRDVRNHFVHISERIGDQLANQHGVTVRAHVGKPDPPHQPHRIFRRYDPTTATLGFGGDEVDVRALASEASRLIDECDGADPFALSDFPMGVGEMGPDT